MKIKASVNSPPCKSLSQKNLIHRKSPQCLRTFSKSAMWVFQKTYGLKTFLGYKFVKSWHSRPLLVHTVRFWNWKRSSIANQRGIRWNRPAEFLQFCVSYCRHFIFWGGGGGGGNNPDYFSIVHHKISFLTLLGDVWFDLIWFGYFIIQAVMKKS